jgi:putative membrane protein
MTEIAANKKYNRIINVLAVAVPVVVAILLNPRIPKVTLGNWTHILPFVNAIINSLTSICLILGLYFIKQKNVRAHRATMLTSFVLGSLFLVCYVLYHLSNESTHFGGEGIVRPIYFFLLFSHIGLSIGVVWFVLRALYFALTNQIDLHKKTVKWAYPIWLYVSVTGVIVYLMISPYYSPPVPEAGNSSKTLSIGSR